MCKLNPFYEGEGFSLPTVRDSPCQRASCQLRGLLVVLASERDVIACSPGSVSGTDARRRSKTGHLCVSVFINGEIPERKHQKTFYELLWLAAQFGPEYDIISPCYSNNIWVSLLCLGWCDLTSSCNQEGVWILAVSVNLHRKRLSPWAVFTTTPPRECCYFKVPVKVAATRKARSPDPDYNLTYC